MRIAASRRLLRVLTASCAAVSMSLVIPSVANSASLHAAHSLTSDVAGRTAIPPNTRLTNIVFYNLSRGYGAFLVQGSVTCSDRFGLTNNGGATFSVPAPVVSWPCANNAPVSSLAFDSHGVIPYRRPRQALPRLLYVSCLRPTAAGLGRSCQRRKALRSGRRMPVGVDGWFASIRRLLTWRRAPTPISAYL
jgi:hypothetical protein